MLKDWSDDHSAKFQKEIFTFRHRLNETGLFTDEALIELLEKHPHNMLDVCSMGDPNHPLYPNRFRTGDFRDVDGKTLLDGAKAGAIWINVRRGMNIHPEYKKVLDQMYGGIAEKTGTKAYNANGGILISSPIAKVPYHFDKTETILWHVRGKKRMYLYPETEEFIPDLAYERTLLSDLEDDLPYRKEFEEHAMAYDLEEGQAISWPLNSPHRVDNTEFCISVTAEFSTRASGMKNAAMIANATLREKFGKVESYRDSNALKRQVKSYFGRALNKSKLAVKAPNIDMVSFKIDPKSPNFIVDIEPYERTF